MIKSTTLSPLEVDDIMNKYLQRDANPHKIIHEAISRNNKLTK